MEVSGLVFNRSACFYSSISCKESTKSSFSSARVCLSRRRSGLVLGFQDNGHLQYYFDKISCKSDCDTVCMAVVGDEKVTMEKKGPMKMKRKKQMKLLKGLSRDLSTFSQIGFGLDLDPDRELLNQVQGSTMSEATELLMAQLHKLKAEKDLKRKQKEEKKRLKAAARMKNRLVAGEMSSSGSSESSDSECGEIVDMKGFKLANAEQDSVQPVIQDAISLPKTESSPVLSSPVTNENLKDNIQTDPCPSISSDLSSGSLGANSASRLEVCMGGKCKKSGAAALLEEFQKVVGIEGAVSGCRCMGKCRDGPNVRVMSGGSDSAGSNSLCIGVGVDDVNMMVANFLGENRNQLHLAPTC